MSWRRWLWYSPCSDARQEFPVTLAHNPAAAELIQHGVPSKGMPAFDLPTPELEAVATFIHSLNAPAAQGIITGNATATAGEQFFFGDGKCASCHMVHGVGSSIGPDLSRVGLELSADHIREVLVNPSARITPGYDLLNVELKNGVPLRGFARNRSDFDLQLQDLEGQFHFLRQDQISSVHNEPSLMQPVRASAQQMQDVIAFLSRLTGAESRRSGEAGPILEHRTNFGIEFSRILSPHPGDWPTYNGNVSGNRFSPLRQIDLTNSDRLAMKWLFPIPHAGLEVTPIVTDG